MMKKPEPPSGTPEQPLTVTVKGAAGVAIARAMLAAFRPRPHDDGSGNGDG